MADHDADSEDRDLVVLPVVPSIVLHHAAGVTRRAGELPTSNRYLLWAQQAEQRVRPMGPQEQTWPVIHLRKQQPDSDLKNARSACQPPQQLPPAIQTSRPGRLHGLKWGPIYDTFKATLSLSMCVSTRNGIWASFMPCEMSSFGTLIAPVGEVDC